MATFLRCATGGARALVLLSAMAVTFIQPGSAMAVSPNGSVVVHTDAGTVRGTQAKGVRSFLGIPYALPPVGELRWRPPQPAARWDGIRDASSFAPHCPQTATPFGVASASEDCLYLNVYAPSSRRPDGELAPVMV